MTIFVTNYSDESKKTPVEYIGILVDPFLKNVFGRVSLVECLKNKKPEEIYPDISMSTDKNALIQELVIEALNTKRPGVEIHIIECYQTVSSLFNLPETHMPTAKNFCEYLAKVLETYKVSFGGQIFLKNRDAAELKENITANPANNGASGGASVAAPAAVSALTSTGMYASTSSDAKKEAEKAEKNKNEPGFLTRLARKLC